MLASALIEPLLPKLQPDDTVGQALGWMQELRIDALPAENNGQFTGLHREALLEDLDPDTLLESLPLTAVADLVRPYQHLHEVIGIAMNTESEVLPVVDEDGTLHGSIIKQKIFTVYLEALGLGEGGAVMILTLEDRDYTLAEVSRLVEANDVKIVSSYFISGDYETGRSGQLVLKLNRQDVRGVQATLERYNYTIKAIYANTSAPDTDQERLEGLFRYLDI